MPESHLNLVKSSNKTIAKRVLPRFPFSHLIFRSADDGRVYQVRDISYAGMRLCLKDGEQVFQEKQDILGTLDWKGDKLEINAVTKWVSSDALGVEFKQSNTFNNQIREFLSFEKIVSQMRPIHNNNLGIDMPNNLRYWMQSDGPWELFVWQYSYGELSKLQMLLMENFIEWVDGEGVKTGRLVTKKDIETPLESEDEIIFEEDKIVDLEKIKIAKNLIENIPDEYIPKSTSVFLLQKLEA